MTDNMREFIEHNEKFKIIEGYRHKVRNTKDKYVAVYIFEDRTRLSLSVEDCRSSNYIPVWKLD